MCGKNDGWIFQTHSFILPRNISGLWETLFGGQEKKHAIPHADVAVGHTPRTLSSAKRGEGYAGSPHP